MGDLKVPFPGATSEPLKLLKDMGDGTHAEVVAFAQPTTQVQKVLAATPFILLGTTGAVGNEVSFLQLVPKSTAPGAVTLRDGINGDEHILFYGGTDSVTSLIPFPINFPAKATLAGWYLEVGDDIDVYAFGTFT